MDKPIDYYLAPDWEDTFRPRIQELFNHIAELEANPLYNENIALHQAYLDRGKRIAELEAHNKQLKRSIAVLSGKVEGDE